MKEMLIVIPYYSDGSGGPPKPHFFPAGHTQARDVARFFANQDPLNFLVYEIGSPSAQPRRVYPEGQGVVQDAPTEDPFAEHFSLGDRVLAKVEGMVYDLGYGKIGGLEPFIGVLVTGDDSTKAFVEVHRLNVEPYS